MLKKLEKAGEWTDEESVHYIKKETMLIQGRL